MPTPAVVMQLTGAEDLSKFFFELGKEIANRGMSSALRKGMNEYAKAMRREIKRTIKPKSGDAGIGVSVKKTGDAEHLAKVGIAVGKSQAKAKANSEKRSRGKRPGVGVDARNLHWFALGTIMRYSGQKKIRNRRGKVTRIEKTGNPRRFHGRIDRATWGGFIQKGYIAAQSEANRKMRESLQKTVDTATKG